MSRQTKPPRPPVARNGQRGNRLETDEASPFRAAVESSSSNRLIWREIALMTPFTVNVPGGASELEADREPKKGRHDDVGGLQMVVHSRKI